MLLIGTLHCESFLEKKLDSVGLEYYLLGDLNFNLASLQYDLNTRRICEISDLCGMGFRAGNKNRRGLVFFLSLTPRVPQTACYLSFSVNIWPARIALGPQINWKERGP